MLFCCFLYSICSLVVNVVEGQAIAVRDAKFFALVDISQGVIDHELSIDVSFPTDILLGSGMIEH